MKIFTNKNIWQKIVIMLVIVMLFQFVITRPVKAKGDVIEMGGKLITPIFSLLVSVGDGIVGLLHSSIMGSDETLINVKTDSSFWDGLKKVLAVIITGACIIGAFLVAGPLGTVLAWTAAASVLSTVLLGSNVIVKLEDGISQAVASQYEEDMMPSELYLPVYSYSPEEIFKGNILLFNVNFFDTSKQIVPKYSDESTAAAYKFVKTNDDGEMIDKDGNVVTDWREAAEASATYRTRDHNKWKRIEVGEESQKIMYYYYIDDDGNEVKTSKQDSAQALKNTISSWYVALRNICLVTMLSVLVYVGIRMLLTSLASDKAKYRGMIVDWFVGLCLLFLMHYIMAFSVTLVEKLTDMVSATFNSEAYYVKLAHTSKLEKELSELPAIEGHASNLEEQVQAVEGNSSEGYLWPSNLMGYLRMKAQMNAGGTEYVGQAIMFLMLVIFTVMYTFTYLRRLLYMAFLTLISPMVALTYCLDKLNDGQAQGFNSWFKEYMFNLLIQPLHLLLYLILVSSAFSTMGENVLYSIVALGFMLPAERLLRGFFGFEKAKTPSLLNGATATALTMNIVKSLGNVGGHSKGNAGSDKAKINNSDEKPPRINGYDGEDELIFAYSGSNGNRNRNLSASANENETGNRTDNQDGSRNRELPDNEDNVNEDRRSHIDLEDPNNLENPDNMNYDEEDEDNHMDFTSIRTVDRPDLESDQDNADDLDRNDNIDRLNPNYLERYGNQNDVDNYEEDENEDINNLNRRNQMSPQYEEDDNEDDRYNEEDNRNDNSKRERSNKQDPENETLRHKVGKRVTGVARGLGATADLKARRFKASHPVRRAVRFAGSTAAGVAVGTFAAGAAVAAASASGRPDAVATGLATSVAVGNKVRGNAANTKYLDDETVEAFKEQYYGDEYEQHKLEEYKRNYRLNDKNMRELRNSFGQREAEEIMQKGGLVDKCIDNGVYDIKDIKAIHQMNKDGEADIDTGIALAAYNQDIGSAWSDPEKKRAWKDDFKEKTMQKNQLDERQAARHADETYKAVKNFRGYKKRLK